jgi:hypothetical protein
MGYLFRPTKAQMTRLIDRGHDADGLMKTSKDNG